MEAVWAVGLMTGTVLDGNVDVALLRTDGERVHAFGPAELRPYPPEVTPVLREALDAAGRWAFEGPEPAVFREAERMLTAAQAQAVAGFLQDHGVPRSEVAVIGFHGQSVLHRAPVPGQKGATRQLGDGEAMARTLGITVAYDFRSADVSEGGQGAPLAPVYHRALLRHVGAGAETAVLNLGGVANITALDEEGGLHAFDTGPANAPLNDWMARWTGAPMDRDGESAARGTVDEQRLEKLLEHPYLQSPYPKSLDRNSFTAAMAEGLSLEDGAATLTAFTAGAVARALLLLPLRPHRLVVSGGGRHNPVLMRELERRTGLEIRDADELGLRGDAVEAECFALLAVRALRGLPLSFPTTTGAPRPLPGGRIAHP